MGNSNTILNAFTGKSQGYSNWRPTWLKEIGKTFELGRKAKAVVTGNNPLGKAGAIHNLAVDARHSAVGRMAIKKIGAAASEGLNQAALKTPFGRRLLHDQKRKERKKLKDRKRRGIKDLPKKPIEPKGEFAYLFGPFMKTILLENVTREHFIKEFIDAINGMAQYNNRDDITKDKALIGIFNDLIKALINKSFTKELNNFKVLEKKKNQCIEYLKEEIKSLQEITPDYKNPEKENVYSKILSFIEQTKKIGNTELKEIENINEGINKFLDEKYNNKEDDNIGKKFNEFVKIIKVENFLNEVHEIIKNKEPDFITNELAKQELVNKLAKQDIKLKKELITPARVFIELNLTEFIERIRQETKIINDRIRQATNRSININPENSSIIKKLGRIIKSHQYFEKELFKLFNYVKNNTDLKRRKADLIKINNLCVILQQINNLDRKNYNQEVKNNNVSKFFDCDFSYDLINLYKQTAQEEMNIEEKRKEELYKLKPGKTTPKKINQIEVSLELSRSQDKMKTEIKTLNMNDLQSKFNELFTELHQFYIPTEKAPQISGIVPPSKVEKSINYKFLLDIFPIFIDKILKLDKALQKELMKEDFDIDKIELFENITQLKVMFVDILQEKEKGNFGNFNKYVANLKEKHKVNNINNDIKWYKEDFGFLQKQKLSKEIDGTIENLITSINKITKKYFPEHKDININRNDADLLNKLRKIVGYFNEKAESFNKKNENNEKKDNQSVIEYLQKLKRIKTIIDVLITRILPSNYNKIRYDVKSSVIDKDINENLDKYLSKNPKNGNLKNEKTKNTKNNKTNEELKNELKNELNQLLIEMYKKFLPEEKIPEMGKNSKQIYPNSNIKPVNTTNPVANIKPVNTTNQVANLGIISGGSRKKIIK
jgi:hypothetical protein